MLEALVERARSEGRTSVIIGAWDAPAPRRSRRARPRAEAGGGHPAAVPETLDRDPLARLYDEALPYAAAYDLVRLAGRSAEADLVALAEMTAAINDAPTDDLDVEDEVFTPERIRDYEDAQTARDHRLYRVFARHRESGELAGHRPSSSTPSGRTSPSSTTHRSCAPTGPPARAAVKLEMLRWLAEDEPQIEQIDTWNAESNDHMIGVNETLGYQIMGRGLDFQKTI